MTNQYIFELIEYIHLTNIDSPDSRKEILHYYYLENNERIRFCISHNLKKYFPAIWEERPEKILVILTDKIFTHDNLNNKFIHIQPHKCNMLCINKERIFFYPELISFVGEIFNKSFPNAQKTGLYATILPIIKKI